MYAKKSLGQNFLISARPVGAIVSAGEITAGETVIEIGPGKGVLTRALLDAGARVKAVEKDDRLIPILGYEFKKEISERKLELIHGDIMEMDAARIANEGAYKVIANIPYYITGAVIRKFLSAEQKPKLMVLMVQKEVATRVMARDGKESILSLSIKAYATPEVVMNVARGNFFPIPNVDSAVIKLSDIKNPFSNAASEERFFEFVKAGFGQKRKKLISNLEAVAPRGDLEKKFAALGIGQNARAEDIKLETWLAMI
jgi:16S rRNA (adenine1518-N6/adenine1519-N6)-dimethyltransferase